MQFLQEQSDPRSYLFFERLIPLAKIGEEAMHVFAAHAEASNHLGLLSEEIDPATRAQLGNFPQAFSHLGLVNAAWRIDLAMRLRDEGAPFGPRLVGPMFRRS